MTVKYSIKIDTIWQEFHLELSKFVYSRVRDNDITKDIIQEVFIKIQGNLHTLKDDKKIISWIYQITRNEIANYFREQNRKLDSNDDIANTVQIKDSHQKLSNCIIPFINQLPEKDREIMILTEINKMSQKDLAIHLGISYSGAKSRVQRARVKLKNLFEQCCTIERDKYGNVINYYKRNLSVDCE